MDEDLGIGLDLEALDPQPVPDVELSPTVARFVWSEVDVPMLRGPRGEGKTTGGIVRIMRVAAGNVDAQPLKVIVVRDTWTNLQRTVSESLIEGARAGWWTVEFFEQGTEAVLNGGIARLYLLGMDRPADANKLQGMSAGMGWIEEPAPAADLSSGVPLDVFGMLWSSLRQTGFPHSLQLTMNPPDEEHWTVSLELSGQALSVAHKALVVRLFNIPPGENIHLPSGYRERMRAAFELAGRQDLIDRLVEGKIGSITMGEAVAPEFNELIHVAKEALPCDPRWPAFRFWDFGLNPTCIWLQLTPRGHLYVLGTRVGQNVGLEQHVKTDVLPFQRKYGLGVPMTTRIARDGSRLLVHEDAEGQALPLPGHQGGFGRGAATGYLYRDLGDHAGTSREQSNSESSAAWTLENMLKTSFEPGPQAWPIRRDSLRAALNRLISGQPFIQIDPTENKPLVKALRGGWRYPKDSAGKVGDKPIKDIHSHPGDALAHGISILYPVHEVVAEATRQARTSSRVPEPKSWLGV